MGAATPRKIPRQARARATVEALLDATARVLVDEGPEHATTNRIAEVAGCSIGSLYQYFPNREALISALIARFEEGMHEQLAQMTAALADAPVEDAIRIYVRAMLARHASQSELHRALSRELPRILGVEGIRAMQQRGESLVRAYLEAHAGEVRPTDLDLAAFLLVTSVEAVNHAALYERPDALTDDAFADELTELVLRYLEPRKRRRPSK